jgi:hypothetical protein
VDDRASQDRRIVLLAVRDALVVALTAYGLHFDATLHGTSGVFPTVVAIVTGFLVLTSGFYVHEWGHYLAARAAGARPVPARSSFSIFLFELDEQACTRKQWLTMSFGGYVASIVGLGIIVAVIDLHALSGQVALGLTSLGVLATFVLEIPITLRVYRQQRA